MEIGNIIHFQGNEEIIKLLKEKIPFSEPREYEDILDKIIDQPFILDKTKEKQQKQQKQERSIILKRRIDLKLKQTVSRTLTIKENDNLIKVMGERNIAEALKNRGISYIMLSTSQNIGRFLFKRETSLTNEYGVIYIDRFCTPEEVEEIGNTCIKTFPFKYEGQCIVSWKFKNEKDTFLQEICGSTNLIMCGSKISEIIENYKEKTKKENKEEIVENLQKIEEFIQKWDNGPYPEILISMQELRDNYYNLATEKEKKRWSKQMSELMRKEEKIGIENDTLEHLQVYEKLLSLLFPDTDSDYEY